MPEAIERVTQALQTEGFGVLTENDVQATLRKKIGVEFRPYKILGACNPMLAFRALTAAPEVGLWLPCNVTVTQTESGWTDISIIDPISMLGFVGRQELAPIADEARAKLSRVAELLKSELN